MNTVLTEGATTLPQWAGSLPQWLSAIAAGFGVFIAWRASKGWANTLKHKRGDDLVTAALDLHAQVGATISAIETESSEIYGSNVDRLFASSRTLLKAFVVAERSYKLDESKLTAIRSFVDRTVDNLATAKTGFNRKAAVGQFSNLQEAAGTFVAYVRNVLKK